MVTDSAVAHTVSEVDMEQLITGARAAGSRYRIAETLCVLAVFVLLLAVGDALIGVALVLAGAVVAVIWWGHRDFERRARGGAAPAPVAQLAHRRGAGTAAGPASRRDARAA